MNTLTLVTPAKAGACSFHICDGRSVGPCLRRSDDWKVVCLIGLFLLFFLPHPARAQDDLTPLPDSVKYDCAGGYRKGADAYWPVVRDILRFNAMFDNYLDMCGREDPKQLAAIKPFADDLKSRATKDVDESYDVMNLIIHDRVPASVPAACRKDTSAQDKAAKDFWQTMDAERRKAGRLARSGKAIEGDAIPNGGICHNLVLLRKDVEKHLSGEGMANPLFEIAALRRLATSATAPQDSRPYAVYRETLKMLQKQKHSDK